MRNMPSRNKSVPAIRYWILDIGHWIARAISGHATKGVEMSGTRWVSVFAFSSAGNWDQYELKLRISGAKLVKNFCMCKFFCTFAAKLTIHFL